MSQIYFESVSKGDSIGPLVKQPTEIQLFRFAGVTWNAHRIHWDKEWAREEGYPNVLVQAQLQGAFLAQVATDWMGPEGVLKRLSWSNRRSAFAGDTLSCHAKVAGTRAEAEPPEVDLELWEENQRGERLVEGAATIALPRRP